MFGTENRTRIKVVEKLFESAAYERQNSEICSEVFSDYTRMVADCLIHSRLRCSIVYPPCSQNEGTRLRNQRRFERIEARSTCRKLVLPTEFQQIG